MRWVQGCRVPEAIAQLEQSRGIRRRDEENQMPWATSAMLQ